MKFFAVVLLFIVYSSSTTTYYLVRHAEKACDDCNTCGLSTDGENRAELLADYLSNKGIDTIFSSQCLRARNTAQPIADLLNEGVSIYQTGQLSSFINMLKSINTTKQILVVGHSNQIPVIIDSLAHQQVFISDTDYDNLFIIKKSRFFRTTVTMKKLTYGAMSQ